MPKRTMVHGLDPGGGTAGQGIVIDPTGQKFVVGDLPGSDALLRVFRPETYGAKGDGVTDDTLGVQGAIDAAAAAGGGTVLLKPNATYLCNGALNTTRFGNSILTLPTTSGITIRILGGAPAYNAGTSIIQTTVTGLTYTSGAVPCLFGGRADGTFTDMILICENVAFLLPNNPSLGGVDAQYVTRLEWRDAGVSVPNVNIQPTHTWAFGLRTPTILNYNTVLIQGGGAYGMYAGLVACPESLTGNYWDSKWCIIGMALTTGGHVGVFAKLSLEWCAYMIAGWTPAAGVTSIQVIGATSYAMLNVDGLAIEDAAAGNWYSTTEHIHDPTNVFRGVIGYVRGETTVPHPTHALILNGATGLSLVDSGLSDPLSSVGVPGSRLVATDSTLTGGGDLTADRTLGVDTTSEAERIRDVIGVALTQGNNVTIAVNDAGDTITISASTGEPLMQDGVTAPPVPIETEARDDWLCAG